MPLQSKAGGIPWEPGLTNSKTISNSMSGAKKAVAVNSCTAALHLALKCTNLEPGDEVIVPAITHASTAEVAIYLKQSLYSQILNAIPILLMYRS